MRYASLTAIAAAALFVWANGAEAQQNPNSMRIAGNFSSNTKHVDNIEKPFFASLPTTSGVAMTINYNPMDVLNVQAADALRLLRSGTFDVMSVQIGMASRDDPFFEGIDLIGVSTDMKQLRAAVDTYRDAFDARLQQRFIVKVLTLWPFGPQVFYCNKEVRSIWAPFPSRCNSRKCIRRYSAAWSIAALLRRRRAIRANGRKSPRTSCRCRCQVRCRATS